LSWEGDEPSAAVAEEGSTPAAEESAPRPQAEAVAPVVEATLPKASVVEGEYTAQTQSSSKSSRSPRETNPVCLLLTGAEAKGNTIPEAVPFEGLAPVSYGPPWAHYLGGYQDRLPGGPLGLPGLRYTVPEGVEHKDYT
jgi:hypothetical protein